MTEDDLLRRIKAHYNSHEYAVLTHVRNTTGHSRTVRTADAMALSLYPSRGINLHGFEVKVSRSDWQRELKAPDKQEEIGAYCHYWWIVTPDETLIRAGELPTGWGWMIADPKGEGLKVVTSTPRRDTPKPLDLLFVASLLRNASDDRHANWVRRSDIASELEAARISGQKSASWSGQASLTEATTELETLRAQVSEFEKISGVDLKTGKYRSFSEVRAVGTAVAQVLAGNEAEARARVVLRGAERSLEQSKEIVTKALAKIKDLQAAAMAETSAMAEPLGESNT